MVCNCIGFDLVFLFGFLVLIWLSCFAAETSKKGIPMMPIAEAPMTPLHEVSRKIPDYVRFGPILPKSAGFSPVLKPNKNSREASRLVSYKFTFSSHSILHI